MQNLMSEPAYISGGITGVENPGELFMKAEKALLQLGWDKVVNPWKMSQESGERNWSRCMADDLEALNGCGVFVRLPGWEKSSGAVIENYFAVTRGMTILDYSEYFYLPPELYR